MVKFKIGDYAQTDRHYGQITFDYGEVSYHGVMRQVVELNRIECLHGPQKFDCVNFERVLASQLTLASSPEETLLEALGEDYL